MRITVLCEGHSEYYFVRRVLDPYLPADLDELKNWLDPQGVDRLRASLGDAWEPEDVNDGRETAPSKRIVAIDKTYEYSKSTVGPNVASSIGIPRLRDRCKHFDEWISALENLKPQK
jgi:hypothetical protein